MAFELARLLARPADRFHEYDRFRSARRITGATCRPPVPPTRSSSVRRLQKNSTGLAGPPRDDARLPALQADAALYRNYVYAEDAPLPCPIRAYGGADDPNVCPEHLEAWAEQTTNSFAVRVFPGGHFYLNNTIEEFANALEADLEQAC